MFFTNVHISFACTIEAYAIASDVSPSRSVLPSIAVILFPVTKIFDESIIGTNIFPTLYLNNERRAERTLSAISLPTIMASS